MDNEEYNKRRKFKGQLNERNLKSIVDYMNLQRKLINDMGIEMNDIKKTLKNYVRIVNDLQQEVGQLRNEVQISRFSSGSSVK